MRSGLGPPADFKKEGSCFDLPIALANPLLIPDWAAWLAAGQPTAEIETIRGNTRTGRPSGSEDFIKSRCHSLSGAKVIISEPHLHASTANASSFSMIFIPFLTTLFVEMRVHGLPVVSRYGSWQRPPEDEVRLLLKSKIPQ